MPNKTLDEITRLRYDLPRLAIILRRRDRIPSDVGFVSGGAPSWEPISLGVEALLADVRREAAELDADLRAEMRLPYRPKPRLGDALLSLAHAYAARSAVDGSLAAERTRARVSVWVGRSRLLLGEAWQPYALRSPDGSTVRCPVVEWTGEEPRLAECGADLRVFRDDATGIPVVIRCRRNKRDHEWQSGPAWLRLGALLRK